MPQVHSQKLRRYFCSVDCIVIIKKLLKASTSCWKKLCWNLILMLIENSSETQNGTNWFLINFCMGQKWRANPKFMQVYQNVRLNLKVIFFQANRFGKALEHIWFLNSRGDGLATYITCVTSFFNCIFLSFFSYSYVSSMMNKVVNLRGQLFPYIFVNCLRHWSGFKGELLKGATLAEVKKNKIACFKLQSFSFRSAQEICPVKKVFRFQFKS